MVKDDATAGERSKIKDSIKLYVDKAECISYNGNNMVFLLPLDAISKIIDLLTFLEDNKECLKLVNLSVTITTLEDVFLK